MQGGDEYMEKSAGPDLASRADDDVEAFLELSFSPNVSLVSTVRRFVSEFYAQVLAETEITSMLAVATHELLENAVRYSSDGKSSIRVGVARRTGGDIAASIDTRNRAAAENIEQMRHALDELSNAKDPEAHYQMLMRKSAKRSDGSGLGLGRIRSEADMTISYRIEGDQVLLQARGCFASGGK
jgi:anti-sigma regulatory factor (Ser/Thr protein kinase)